jgi:hypothetical protein
MRYLILLLLLSACGGADNHGYGWHYDVSGDTGLRVRYDRNSQGFPIRAIELWYKEIQDCMGLSASAPLIIFVPDLIDNRHNGRTYDNGSILITSIFVKISSPEYVVKHELIHHLFFQNGDYSPNNTAHSAFIFKSYMGC